MAVLEPTNPSLPGGILLSDQKFITYAECEDRALNAGADFVLSGSYKDTEPITISKLVASDTWGALVKSKLNEYAQLFGKASYTSIPNYYIPKYYVQYEDQNSGGGTGTSYYLLAKSVTYNASLYAIKGGNYNGQTIYTNMGNFMPTLTLLSTDGSSKTGDVKISLYNTISGSTVSHANVDTSTTDIYLYYITGGTTATQSKLTRVSGPYSYADNGKVE